MKRISKLALLAVLALGVTVAVAEEQAVTLEGKVVCAKCTLKKDDAKECQNVLLVAGADGKDAAYYITSNEVAEKFGEVCTDVHKARVTGTVSDKDARKWITASKMEKVKG